MNKVILYGPQILSGSNGNSYGGGTGGYTRNMLTYINFFKSDEFEYEPCFHTIRGQLKIDNFAVRMVIDTLRVLKKYLSTRASAVHVLAQYRTAFPREVMVYFLSRLFRIPFVYEIKAGAFIEWYEGSGKITRKLVKRVLQGSWKVLVEGQVYGEYIGENFGVQTEYFPNYVPIEIVPGEVPQKLAGHTIRVLFVGFCYRGKGVFELVEGLNIAAQKGIDIELTLVGQESPEFTDWLDEANIHEKLVIHRMGRRDYPEVMVQFEKNDCYIYPSKHSGEGHNNTINEAMMHGMIIVTTRKGFIGNVLSDSMAYLIDSVSAELVCGAMEEINANRYQAREKAQAARQALMDNYTSEQIFPRLVAVYKGLH